ncbi:hypothetical protein B0H65DRAFT_75266 [Neurospora tetraspora]|uniref:Peptidase M20 dimerisation domain-containing protein n=1 Tax=Neurospora tetraspora TaxID=94610 RepID=A0AAE0MK03_9PEZI|nr:hypothetical protein B0H65DRAFT_75266 [Neurospora tetraspora]
MIPQIMRPSVKRLATRGLSTRPALAVTSCQRHRFLSLSSRLQNTNTTTPAGEDERQPSPTTTTPVFETDAPRRRGRRPKSTTSDLNNYTPPPDAVPGSASSYSPASNSDISSLSTFLKSHNQLSRNIHETCSQFGAAHRWGPGENDTGMNRLALTDADKQVRNWFVKEARALGCEVEVDEMGNIWAIRDGVSDRRPTKDGKRLPPVMMGSHLDTQPRGGRYDGVLGVMAGLEALRALKEQNVKTWRPVGVVCWTNEEGARFPVSMVSSGVWAGEIPLERAHSLKEVSGEGKTMKEELERIGYLGDKKCSFEEMPMAAHFELHIEQGPILEAKGKKVGVVRGSQAYKWFTIEVVGKEAHTGTTPYAQRADALMVANSMIRYARYKGEVQGVLVSVGVYQVFPGSVNTIPGRVKFSLDIRSPSDHTLVSFERRLRRKFDVIAERPGFSGLPCSVTWQEDTNSPAQGFDERCCKAVKESALSVLGAETGDLEQALGLVKYQMVSGAGHDSVNTAKRCPTSMIFVPSKGGLSHHPEEFTSEEDCVRGAQVLLESVLRFDREVWREDLNREKAGEQLVRSRKASS